MTFYYNIIFNIIGFWLLGMAFFFPVFLVLCKAAKCADKLTKSLFEKENNN